MITLVLIAMAGAADQQAAEPPVIRAAAVQFLTSDDVDANADRIIGYLEAAARQDVRVVAFTEMALTGYTKKAAFLEEVDWEAVYAALDRIGEACDRLDIYAVVGTPTRDGEQAFCSAVVFDPDGEVIDTYEKIYRAGEAWAKAGRHLSSFEIDGVLCGTIICHDERYPALVQLRALKGVQLFFYISCESGMNAPHKIGPYRAQIQARAVENEVFVVQANTPAKKGGHDAPGTSHGESRIIGPDGNIIEEAPAYGDAMVVADLNMAHASKAGREASLTEGPLAEWMREGLRFVEGPAADFERDE